MSSIRSRRVRAARVPALRALLALAVGTGSLPAHAVFQNGGFEQNNFNGWTLEGGINPGLSGSPPFTGASVQISPGAAGPADIVGQLADPRAPMIALPRAGTLTARLNNEGGGALVTRLRQIDTLTTADIDPADGLPHLRFAFAPVLDDPNHAPHEQPYFYVAVRNLADNSVLFEQFAYSGQPGVNFLQGSGSWKYLPFQDVDAVLPLSAIGQPIELVVIAADCSLGGHGGYVYVDGFGSSTVGPPGGGSAEAVAVPVGHPFALGALAALLAALAWRRTRHA